MLKQEHRDQCLRQALKGMHIETVRLLFQYGANVDVGKVDSSGSSWLHSAADWDGSDDIMIALLGRSAKSVSAQRFDGQTPLHLACTAGRQRAIEALLKHGAKVNVQDDVGDTPLHKIAAWQNLEHIESILVRNGADQHLRNQAGERPIDIAKAIRAPKSRILEPCQSVQGSDDDPGNHKSISQATNPETRVFNEVRRRLVSRPRESVDRKPRLPTRLIDITTGELVAGGEEKRYVIVSYLWSPQTYQHPRAVLESHYALVPGFFEDVVEALRHSVPAFVQQDECADESLPQPDWTHSLIDADYLKEVYMLAAMEARDRCIRHVWMDSLCIDQASATDKENEIPHMADYYRGSECCLVISELLRQELCVGWQNFRRSSECAYGPVYRVRDWVDPIKTLSVWITGYHHHRVWTFQETLLAPEVVVRGSGVRINASKVIEDGFAAQSPSEASWTQDRWTQGMFPFLATDFPIKSTSSKTAATPRSLSHCRELLETRECSLPQDRIYGILGLFPPALREAVPVDYTIPFGAALANCAFVSICDGELVNLFRIRDFDAAAHAIRDAPSWIPSGTASPFERVVDMNQHVGLRFTSQPSMGQLMIYMPYLPISDVRARSDDYGRNYRWGRHNTIIRPKDRNGHALSFVSAVAVELVHLSSGRFRSSAKPNAKRVLEEQMLRENEARRSKIQAAADAHCAVMASIGTRALVQDADRPTMWLWLILCTEDGGLTWTREAMGVTGEPKVELQWQEFVIR